MHTFLLSQHYSRLVCNYTIIYYVCKNIDHRTNQSKKAETLRKYNIQIKMTIFFPSVHCIETIWSYVTQLETFICVKLYIYFYACLFRSWHSSNIGNFVLWIFLTSYQIKVNNSTYKRCEVCLYLQLFVGVLFNLVVFVCVVSITYCIVFVVWFVFVLCLVFPVLPVSLDCLFLVAPSVFSIVYLHINH